MTAEFKAAKSGPLHGLAGWFEAELAPGIWMTNAPGDPEAISRPQAFFPIDPPIDVSRGEVIRTSLVIRHAGGSNRVGDPAARPARFASAGRHLKANSLMRPGESERNLASGPP